MTFGKRLQQVRKAAGLSQEQLAELVGMSRQAVSKWETDQAAPDIDKLASLCGVLGVSADELLGRDVPPGREGQGANLEGCVMVNAAKRCFTAGWVTALVGAALLVAEFFALFAIQDTQIRLAMDRGIGYLPDAIQYAAVPPMPAVFGVTIAVIAAGAALAAGGLLAMNGKGLLKKRKAP